MDFRPLLIVAAVAGILLTSGLPLFASGAASAFLVGVAACSGLAAYALAHRHAPTLEVLEQTSAEEAQKAA